jgi:large subunit ribosomal protein L15
MQIHELKRNTKRIKAKTIGRGGKRGKTSGRGNKGQKARAGHRIRPEIRDMIKKLPKLRGRGKNLNKAFAVKNAVVSLEQIEKNFDNGQRVTPQSLFDKNIIKKIDGKFPPVKILLKGEISKKIIIKSCLISEKAKEKIVEAGGQII